MLKRSRPPLCRKLLFRATGGSISSFAPCSRVGVGIRSISHSAPLFDVAYEGISDDNAKVINKHALQPQTSVSLQALMRTGRGEFLHKHFEDIQPKLDQHTATSLVLIQVCIIHKVKSGPQKNSHLSHSFIFALLSTLGRKFSASRTTHSISSSSSRLGRNSYDERHVLGQGS
jgi:hypothetical protein